MGTFATKKILQGNPSLIPVIAEQIKQNLRPSSLRYK